MTMKVNVDQLSTAHLAPGHWVTDASDIGLAPGQWPNMIEIVGLNEGNGLPFLSSVRLQDGVRYKQPHTRLELLVVND